MARVWKNWAGNQSAHARVVKPPTVHALKDVVREVAARGGRIRATGYGHSWSPLVPVGTEDTIIDMTGLTDVLAVDERRPTVTVEAGRTIGDLTTYLSSKQLTLFTPTLYPQVTIGGVISTGGHGTDRHVGSFADQLAEITIITWNGKAKTLRAGDADFPAAQVALGALGIVYSVTLKIERQFSVHTDVRQVPVRYVLEEFDDLVQSYDYVEIFWYPLQDYMWLYLMSRTYADPDTTGLVQRTISDARDQIEDRSGQHILPYIAQKAPRLTPALSWFASSVSHEVHESVLPASDAFHFQRAYVPSLDMDYAVPIADAARAWKRGIGLVEEYARANLYPVNLALHSRITAKSNAWLAPNYDRETCHIEAATAIDTQGWKEFFLELENRWMSIPGARPHWGKLFYHPREVAARYPKMSDFLAVREAWDPNRVFVNDFLENSIFLLNRPAARARRRGGA